MPAPVDGTWTHYTFEDSTCKHSLQVALGDWLMTERGRARVIRIEEAEWRFSHKPKLRLILEAPADELGPAREIIELLHPDLRDRWPTQLSGASGQLEESAA